eukprot:TRINITY_DN40690_c0_g1_i1.p1 TRINITY_DN40690_c0_g1~~TRINITY_DN40690_c0_g1_i1.p1  ORF type:complete len:456 (+),score=81.86 TRINITY_DN40690_c0_g1_i1:111-1478(+)
MRPCPFSSSSSLQQDTEANKGLHIWTGRQAGKQTANQAINQADRQACRQPDCPQDIWPFVDLLGLTMAVTLLPRSLAPMSGFDTMRKGRNIMIQQDACVARHAEVGIVKEEGIVIGNSVIPWFPYGRYVEVEIESIRALKKDGFAIGVSRKSAEELVQVEGGLPTTALTLMDKAKGICLFGYGNWYYASNFETHEINLHSGRYEKGDRFGLLVHPSGEIYVILNGEIVYEAEYDPVADTNKPLYLIVDVGGRVAGVRFIRDAQPPQWASHREIAGFNAHVKSQYITFSKDHLTASHSDAIGKSLFGLAFADGALPEREDTSFAVRVTKLRPNIRDDTLVIGVTLLDPRTFTWAHLETFETGDCVPLSWTFGYSGLATSPASDQFVEIDFKPAADMREGSTVAIRIDAQSRVFFLVNNKVRAEAQAKVPTHARLYPFVDLYGSAMAVTILHGLLPS